MVVVQMREDHVRRSGGIDADTVQAVGRTAHETALATHCIVGPNPVSTTHVWPSPTMAHTK